MWALRECIYLFCVGGCVAGYFFIFNTESNIKVSLVTIPKSFSFNVPLVFLFERFVH